MTNIINIKFSAIILSLFLLFSCTEIIDEHYKDVAQENYISPYMGKWVGSYTGDTSGSLVLNVNKSGHMEITRMVNNNVQEVYYTDLLGGGSGSLNPSTSPTGFTLYGSLQTKSGTWKQQNWIGSWSVTRQ